MSTIIRLFSTLLLCAFVFGGFAEAKNCKKGKPCGNSCISMNDVCHKDEAKSKAAAAPTVTEPVKSEPVPTEPKTWNKEDKASGKKCSKGKACGNTCIAQDAVCHEK